MIPAIVLAAGRSTRMGRSKAMLRLDARDTFLTRIVRTFFAAGIDDVVIVLGHEAERVAASFNSSGLPGRLVVNAGYESGQLSSVVAGLSVVDRPGVVATLLTLVDVPVVSAPTVRAVVDRYRETRSRVVRPTSGARHGHPVLIDRSLFDLVRRADPGEGIKPIVRAHASADGDVQVDDAGAFLDVDTPAEYDALIATSGIAPR
jgi:molybdenum cofactor cytidylyltransferase